MVEDKVKSVTVKESIVKGCFVTLFIEVTTELAPKFDAVYSIRVKQNDFKVDVI